MFQRLRYIFSCASTMPALIEYRLGSIFDEPCDLLVIPSSAGGTVTPEIQQEIRKAGLPFPTPMSWGTITVHRSENPLYSEVAYVAAVSGHRSSSLSLRDIQEIGLLLGKLVERRPLIRISAPVIGAGSDGFSSKAAADALRRGFQQAAPHTAVLVLSVRSPDELNVLRGQFTRAKATDNIVSADMRSRQKRLGEFRRIKRPAQAAPPTPPTTDPVISRPPSSTQKPGRKGVFVSYSHADAEWLKRLQKHLRPLEREGVVVWDDTRLRPGEPWREEIRKALAETKVTILLISADFLASEFIVTDELPPLLKAAEDDGATILPVIISPSRFDRMESLSRFQAVNDPRRPLVQLRRGNREKVLDDVARAVEDALKR